MVISIRIHTGAAGQERHFKTTKCENQTPKVGSAFGDSIVLEFRVWEHSYPTQNSQYWKWSVASVTTARTRALSTWDVELMFLTVCKLNDFKFKQPEGGGECALG